MATPPDEMWNIRDGSTMHKCGKGYARFNLKYYKVCKSCGWSPETGYPKTIIESKMNGLMQRMRKALHHS